MLLDCSELVLVMVRNPSTEASSSSSTSVTADSITCGLAPGRMVLTETIGGSTSGYGEPTTVAQTLEQHRRAALIMLAKTGRWMEMSEIFMVGNRKALIEGRDGLSTVLRNLRPAYERLSPKVFRPEEVKSPADNRLDTAPAWPPLQETDPANFRILPPRSSESIPVRR